MSNSLFTTLAWLGFAAHVVAGLVAWRRIGDVRLVAGVNLIVALIIVGYWTTRWYAYLADGAERNITDQLFPMFAVLVASLATGTLAGWWTLAGLHWTVLALHGLVLLGAVLYAGFFRMKMF
jgi:hypothetical protein